MNESEKSAWATLVDVHRLTMFATGSWRRRVARRIEVPPSEQDWDEYHEAVDLLERLREHPLFWEGCSCDHAHIEEPRSRYVYIYAETEEEWAERVRAKLAAGEKPDNNPIKYSQDVVDHFYGTEIIEID